MLSVQDISLERYFKPVFEPVSLQVQPGRLLLLTGDNGSGKTTLLRLLAGILSPSRGEISFTGKSMSYVGHLLGIKDDLDVHENIEFMARLFGDGARSTPDIIGQVGLRRVATQLARTLSAGQRKRCALARLLVGDSDLWLLDEPYSNLDRDGIRFVDALLENHLENGGACVMATHGSLRPHSLPFEECVLISGQAVR